MYSPRSLFKIRGILLSAAVFFSIGSLPYIWSKPSLTDLIDDVDDIDVDKTASKIDPTVPDKDKNSLCNRHTPTTSEELTMRATPCKSDAALKCEIGGSQHCLRDKEAFKTISKIDKSMLLCMLEANTENLKNIRFIVKAKLLKNSDGSRSMSADEKEIQRGKCTLGYTCTEDPTTPGIKYLKNIKVDCFSFTYNENDKFINGTNKEFHTKWNAPPNYLGPVDFSVMVSASFSEFNVKLSTTKISIGSS